MKSISWCKVIFERVGLTRVCSGMRSIPDIGFELGIIELALDVIE